MGRSRNRSGKGGVAPYVKKWKGKKDCKGFHCLLERLCFHGHFSQC